MECTLVGTASSRSVLDNKTYSPGVSTGGWSNIKRVHAMIESDIARNRSFLRLQLVQLNMQISNSVILGFFAAAVSAVAGVQGAAIEHVARQSSSGGVIVDPAVGTHIAADTYYIFDYRVPTYCRPPGHTSYNVYLTRDQPVQTDVTDNGELDDYLHYYGTLSQPTLRTFLSW